TTRGLLTICTGDVGLVAAGANGAIVRESGGFSWSDRSINMPIDFHGVAYGNGTFVLVGTDRSGLDLNQQDGMDRPDLSHQPNFECRRFWKWRFRRRRGQRCGFDLDQWSRLELSRCHNDCRIVNSMFRQ